MNKINACFVAAASWVLVGCSGGGDGGYCTGAFVGGDADVSCVSCAYSDEMNAIDDRESTYTSLVASTNASTISYSVSAPSGMSFPAGANAGALVTLPAGSYTLGQIRFNAYRAGVPVATGVGGAATGATGQFENADRKVYLSAPTILPFDELEMVILFAGNLQSAEVRVYEMCGDR